MAHPKYCSPFPRLELSLADKRELCRITKQLVGEVVDGYERFLWNDKSQLDPFRWALVKERDDVHVYNDRSVGPRTDSKDLNVLLTIGSVAGSLEDALYGMLNHTTELMRLKTAYVKDTLINCDVLETIQEPTMEKPFRSMTIKWAVKQLPFHMRAVTRNRDLVFVESMGTKILSNGERIGFQLLHSVDFKYTQPLPAYIRGNVSICSIWRQKSADRTEVFMKSFIEVPDRLLAPLVLRSSADALVSVGRVMHVAQMKKVTWLMRRRSLPPQERKFSCTSRSGKNGCATCGVPTPVARSSRQAAKSTCVICTRSVCNSCRVRRELCFIDNDNCLEEKRMALCVPCLSVASKVESMDVASDELSGGHSSKGQQLSELVKSHSVARFSFSPSMDDTGSYRHDSKRRSMTLVAPLPSTTSTASTSSSYTPRVTPRFTSSSWVNS